MLYALYCGLFTICCILYTLIDITKTVYWVFQERIAVASSGAIRDDSRFRGLRQTIWGQMEKSVKADERRWKPNETSGGLRKNSWLEPDVCPRRRLSDPCRGFPGSAPADGEPQGPAVNGRRNRDESPTNGDEFKRLLLTVCPLWGSHRLHVALTGAHRLSRTSLDRFQTGSGQTGSSQKCRNSP